MVERRGAATEGIRHRAAVLGSPIGHSLSPALHAAAYRVLGLRGWSYDAHEVTEEALPGFVAGLDDSWAGLSLTMPLKEIALEVAAEASSLAHDLGVANTLVRRADGAWWADNTDVYGVVRALGEAGWPGPGDPSAEAAVIIGSGATARSALAALAGAGVREVVLLVRDTPRPAALALAERRSVRVRVCREAEGAATELVATSGLVVNTAPAGASDTLALRVEATTPEGRQVLLDVVYDGWPTPLARVFERRGASVVGGLDLLVHQAVRQVALMTGLEPPPTALRDAGLAALSGR